ncbi:class I mannose-6-phosphate isomerase [Qipengyuania sp. CAU 1752]
MQLLSTHHVEKIWGRDQLPAPFCQAGNGRTGEIWFDPPPNLPQLLVKYLFTSEKLSVQVHPGGEQAPDGASGKEECWYIIDAEPGARLAVGLNRACSTTELRLAALDGSIEDLLAWHEVKAGDFFYLPAGTIHAIGPGISLIEVQQNSDITYRLYDYGRPRELHLDLALEVARPEPYAKDLRHTGLASGEVQLVDGPHFRLVRIEGAPSVELSGRYRGPVLLVPIKGDYRVGGSPVAAGACALVDNIVAIECVRGQALIAQPC